MLRNLEKKDSSMKKLILYNLRNAVAQKLDNFNKFRDTGNKWKIQKRRKLKNGNENSLFVESSHDDFGTIKIFPEPHEYENKNQFEKGEGF